MMKTEPQRREQWEAFLLLAITLIMFLWEFVTMVRGAPCHPPPRAQDYAQTHL